MRKQLVVFAQAIGIFLLALGALMMWGEPYPHFEPVANRLGNQAVLPGNTAR